MNIIQYNAIKKVTISSRQNPLSKISYVTFLSKNLNSFVNCSDFIDCTCGYTFFFFTKIINYILPAGAES